MKLRIAIWAGLGFLIAAGWAVYAFAAPPPAMLSGSPTATLAEISCPIVLAGIYFHFGVSLYWSLVANAVTYALIGLIVETARRRLNPAK